jgi:hypothetical protein
MAQKLLVGTDIRIHMHNYYISLSWHKMTVG